MFSVCIASTWLRGLTVGAVDGSWLVFDWSEIGYRHHIVETSLVPEEMIHLTSVSGYPPFLCFLHSLLMSIQLYLI
jgi:hypothetical protein